MAIANIEVEADLWFANPLPNGGYTWTLASRLGHMLRIAEERYGPRDLSHTILGVEFGGDIPHIWYPGNCGHVIVQIAAYCVTDMQRACYQMAHECIHLLSPTGNANTIVLEEGLATYFSAAYMQEQFHAIWHPGPGPYHNACLRVQQLLMIDPTIIATVRQEQPTIAQISAADLRGANANVTEELADALAQPFAMH
jgi:hypothetical protein